MSYLKHNLDWGRLGNQLFCLASTIGLASKYGATPCFPKWKYDEYFDAPLGGNCPSEHFSSVAETDYHYVPEQWDKIKEGNWRLDGFLQSEKYFEEAKTKVKYALQWNSAFYRRVHSKLPQGRETIAISVRKGQDYKDNGNYEILPILYYILALEEYFPQWRENYNVVIFSDEMGYCKHHLQGPNIYYGEGSDIEQLCLMSMCDHFVLANSTFSWWGAWLGEKENSIVVRPAHYFAGELLRTHNIKDFWPERWRIYDHKNKKILLTDITFTIPFHFDHSDRKANLFLALTYLDKYFDTNIIIGQQGPSVSLYTEHRKVDFPEMNTFHRTKILNDLCNLSDTPYIANYDADLVIPPLQILNAVHALRRGFADMVYPYDGRFARIPRPFWLKKMTEEMDTAIFKDEVFMGTRDQDQRSVGGAVFFNKESFIYGGMENENMISYAPEDVERFERFTRLEYRVQRIQGMVYHMDHYIGPNSSMTTEQFHKNSEELQKERAMSDYRLLEYVDSWPWAQKYSDRYYENIVEDAKKAAVSILDNLFKMIQPSIKSVIDVGCGLGEFSQACTQIGYDYFGVDLRMNRSRLLFPEHNYRDFDLRENIEDFPYKGPFGLVICTEVVEHLPETATEQLIKLLTQLGDIVLFSGAIPYQGGLSHLSEKWQSHWAKLFEEQGFYPYKYDIRHVLRDNEDVSNWYKQNIIVYTKDKYVLDYKLDHVLPQMYINSVEHYKKLNRV